MSDACVDCGLPGSVENPLFDYEHDQGCLIYIASGTCTCGRPGHVAHRFRCPVFVEGDCAPPPLLWDRRMSERESE